MNRYKFFSLLVCFCSLFTGAKAAFHINEIMAANASAVMDPTYNFGGWVEVYNDSFVAQSLYGYYLSTDEQNLKQFRIANVQATVPARGYFVIYFDHHNMNTNQIDDKLDCEGATLYLVNRTGGIADVVSYPEQIINTSYSRMTDGDGEWGVCITPTPGASNKGGTFASVRCEAPIFSRDGGVFTQPVTVNLSSPEGKNVYYTLDGTEPTESSNIWTKSLTISSSLVIRACVFEAGLIPSPLVSRSFIISDHEITLPVVCLCTDPKFLTDNTIGIYVKGTNGTTGNGQSTPCNFNQDWQRPANMEYYVNGKLVVDQQCDITVGGGWTRSASVKSLKLAAEKKFEGKNSFDYEFFAQRPGRRYKGIYLRNGGNDFGNSMMNDAFQHCLADGVLDIDCQAYQPVVHFINGKYYGIINLRERSNTQYVYSNYGYDKDEIDLVEKIAPSISPYFEVKTGTIDAMDDLITLSQKASDATVYKQIEELMDVDEFIAYFIPEIFSGNWDWPENNVKFFRHRDGGRFRWILYDLENGWSSSYNSFSDGNNGITGYNNTGDRAQYSHSATLFRNLITNATFKNRFIDYMSLCLGTLYTHDRITCFVDSIAALIRPEMKYEQSNLGLCWGFEGAVSGFKTTMDNRPLTVMNQMKSFFSLAGKVVALSLSSNVPKAVVSVNNIPLPLATMNGYTFTGRNLTLKAQAPAGYRFKQWNCLQSGNNTVFAAGSSWKYYDKGSLDGSTWYAGSYSDNSWQSGNAPLGYSKDGLATTVSYGGNSSNKNPTTYFRSSFSLSSLKSSDTFNATLSIDDAAIVYMNGSEVYRYNLNSGSVTYNTYANSYASGNPDVVNFTIPASAFKSGKNVMAVEVHQNSASSTDIYLDLAITQNGSTTTQSREGEEWTFAVTDAINVEAEFEKMEQQDGAAPLPSLRINEVSASNKIYQNEYFKKNDWIELYNTTGEPVSLAGLYITNDLGNPLYYQIPDAPVAVVPAYGYYILWADKLENKTAQHLPFKLPAEGGKLMISRFEGNEMLWCDSLTYVPHTSEHTFGRYPDGCDSVYLFNRTSYQAANIFSPCNVSASAMVTAFNDSINNQKGGTSPVEPLPDGEKTVVAVTYYNINGISFGAIKPVDKGTFVRSEQLSDGSRRQVKFVNP